jgi:hypothetical protein
VSTSQSANVGLSQDQLQALTALGLFRGKVNFVVDEFSDALQNISPDNLKQKVEKFSGILDSFEMMGTEVSNLLHDGEHKGGVDNGDID